VKFVLDYVQHNPSHIFPSEEALTYSLFKQFHENHSEDFGTLPHIDKRTTPKILSWFVSSARAILDQLGLVQIRDASEPPVGCASYTSLELEDPQLINRSFRFPKSDVSSRLGSQPLRVPSKSALPTDDTAETVIFPEDDPVKTVISLSDDSDVTQEPRKPEQKRKRILQPKSEQAPRKSRPNVRTRRNDTKNTGESDKSDESRGRGVTATLTPSCPIPRKHPTPAHERTIWRGRAVRRRHLSWRWKASACQYIADLGQGKGPTDLATFGLSLLPVGWERKPVLDLQTYAFTISLAIQSALTKEPFAIAWCMSV
jgi:hypothetical protein